MRRTCLLVSLIAAVTACDDDVAGGTDVASPDTSTIDVGIAPDVDVEPSDAEPMDAVPDAAPAPCVPRAPEFTAYALGPWRVDVDPVDGAWQIARPDDEAVVMRSAADCVDGVRRPRLNIADGAPGLETAFGSFRVYLDGPRSRLEWRAVDHGAPTIAVDGGRVELAWAAHTLVFALDGDGLRVELVADADAGALAWRCGEDTGFYGLGTQVVGLDLRGHRFPLWTQEQGIGKPPDGQPFPVANIPEAAYAPMGIWHSSDGASAVVTHDAFSEIDLCAAASERAELRSYGAMPGFVLLPGIDLRQRLEAFGRRVGTAPPVPDWALGPWNDAVGGPERLAEVAERLRTLDIPSSAIWSEDWIGGTQTPTGFRLSYAWQWDPETYPDLPTDIERLHARGFAFLGYFNPFVPDTVPMFAEGEAGGWLIEDADGELITFRDPAFRTATLIDLSDPGARDWLRAYQITAARELGIDGWMADFAEWLPVDAAMHDGSTGWDFHNRYPLAWQQANVDAMVEAHPDKDEAGDWIFFARSGWASLNGATAAIAPALWAGDQNTDWGRDDGLPTIVPIGVNAGLAGVAMFGHDIAGYTSETVPNTTKELFYRWSMLGAFSPLMRTHHGSDKCTNWAFDRDEDTVEHYRRYAAVHTLLFPYLRARMAEANDRGWPIMRHPAFTAPSSPGLWRDARDQYFLGDDLLVAPVVEQAAVERDVHLPGDGWWPLFGATALDAGEAGPGRTVVHRVAAPVTEIPVFVRPGTALPLLPQVVDSFYGATEDGVTDLDTVGDGVRLALYPTDDGVVLPVDVGETTVEGGGWTAAPDWSTAVLGEEALPPCADAADVGPCAFVAGVRLPATTDVSIRVGEAVLFITGGPPRDWIVGWAGEAWGRWAAPTSVGDLDPDIPPPCEED